MGFLEERSPGIEDHLRGIARKLPLVRPDSPARVPILAHLSAVDAELAERGRLSRASEMTPLNLTPAQLARIGQLSDQWSFLWDKRRSLWIC